MPKLTIKELEAIKPDRAGQKIRDDAGLFGVVRARSDGGVSVYFEWKYRYEGKFKTVACGSWPKENLKAIRESRDRFAAILKGGKDPAGEKRAEKLASQIAQKKKLAELAELTSRLTVRELFKKWHRLDLQKRKDKGAEVERSFEKDVFPKIGNMLAEDVKRAHVANILNAVVERGARIVARNLLGDIRQMYGFAIDQSLVENDPTSGMKRDRYGKKVPRDRVLSEGEIKELWKKLPGGKLLKASEYAILIMLSTLCRVGELSAAKWADVDLEAATWRIPPENAKNGKEHLIHLSPFALEHFKALKTLTGTVTDERGESKPGVWCYPSERLDGEHICLKSISKQIRDRQRLKEIKGRGKPTGALLLEKGEWTPHDLRRSGATLMGALGVRPDIIEKCLNHVEKNALIRTYQHQTLEAEKRQAWALLGDRLDLLTRDLSNVIALTQSAA